MKNDMKDSMEDNFIVLRPMQQDQHQAQQDFNNGQKDF